MNKTKFVVQSLYWHYCARYLPFHEVRRCLFPVYKLKLIIETNLNKSLNPKILKIKKNLFDVWFNYEIRFRQWSRFWSSCIWCFLAIFNLGTWFSCTIICMCSIILWSLVRSSLWSQINSTSTAFLVYLVNDSYLSQYLQILELNYYYRHERFWLLLAKHSKLFHFVHIPLPCCSHLN